MAKRPARIDIGVSNRTTAELLRLQKRIENISDTTMQLVGAFKQLNTLTKAIQANMRLNGRGGLQGYLQGVGTQERVRSDRMNYLGRPEVRDQQLAKERTRQAREIVSIKKQERALQDSLNMSLRQQERIVTRTKDIDKLRAAAKQLELRQQAEINRGGVRAAMQAEKLARLARERVATLQAENRTMAARRRNKLDMLFGDGGASLFKVQAGLAANYMVMNQVRMAMGDAARFTIELDGALRNLQAIVRITDTEMGNLKKSLIDISEETKFTAVEVANAAVTLGQAGFSVQEIKDSARAVTLLATATGTDLGRAVDIATSTLGVFNLESSQMIHVANVMTEAVNSSKLNIEKLTLGLQYSGNIAAQSGIQFEELTAALGAMANSGIRAGSTIGTGMRQILIALQKPSIEFRATLDRLGLTMADVDLRTKGLYGVLSTLKDAGFSAQDAIRSFEVRAASAFNAIQNNLDTMLDLEESFINTNAAVIANVTQMRSLTNQQARFQSVLGSVVATGLEPFLYSLRDLLSSWSDFLSGLRDSPALLQGLTVSVVSLGTALAAMYVGRLVTFLGVDLIRSVFALRTAVASTTTIIGGLGVALRSLLLILGPIGIALATAGAAYAAFNREQGTLANTLDKARARVERSSGAVEKYASKIESVGNKIRELSDRSQMLTENQRLLDAEIERVEAQFASMGQAINLTGSTVYGLISALQSLQQQLGQQYLLKIGIQVGDLKGLIQNQEMAIKAATTDFSSVVQEFFGNTKISVPSPDGLTQNIDGPPKNAVPSFIKDIVDDTNNFLIDPSNRLNDGSALYERIQMRLGELDTANISSSDRALSRQVLQAYRDQIQPLLNLNFDLMATRDELDKARINQQTASQRGSDTFQSLSNDLLLFREERTRGINAYGDTSKDLTSEQRYQGAQQIADIFSDRSKEILSRAQEANRLGLINDPLLREIENAIAKEQGEIDRFVDDTRSGTEKVRIANQEDRIGILDERLSNFSRELSSAKSSDKIDELASSQRAIRRQKFEEEVRLIEMQTPDPADQEIALNRATASYEADVRGIDLQAQQAKEGLTKRGGGGGEDPFERFMNNLQGGLSGGILSGDTARIDFVMQTAREELEKLTSKINDFAGKQNLTVAQQKELTKLTEQHAELKDWIVEAEQQITGELRKQGQLQVDIRGLIKEWSETNLNLGNTLESGLTGILSNLKSSFADVFTSVTDGTKTAKEAFRDFAISVIRSIQQLLAEMLAMMAIKSLFSAFGLPVPGASTGGAVGRALAYGGEVQGVSNRDTEHYRLMPGEYVLRRSAVQAVGVEYLDHLNAMGNRRMATGGHIGAAKKGNPMGDQNIWLVDERSKAPIPGPNDVIAIISDDMMRNGITRRLIKGISAGTV